MTKTKNTYPKADSLIRSKWFFKPESPIFLKKANIYEIRNDMQDTISFSRRKRNQENAQKSTCNPGNKSEERDDLFVKC